MSVLNLLPTWRSWLTFLVLIAIPWIWFGVVVLIERLAERSATSTTLLVIDDTGRLTHVSPIE